MRPISVVILAIDDARRARLAWVLRGGIRVSNDEDLGAYEHIRYVLGLTWDSDGDGSPEAYSCGPGAASVLAVVP